MGEAAVTSASPGVPVPAAPLGRAHLGRQEKQDSSRRSRSRHRSNLEQLSRPGGRRGVDPLTGQPGPVPPTGRAQGDSKPIPFSHCGGSAPTRSLAGPEPGRGLCCRGNRGDPRGEAAPPAVSVCLSRSGWLALPSGGRPSSPSPWASEPRTGHPGQRSRSPAPEPFESGYFSYFFFLP